MKDVTVLHQHFGLAIHSSYLAVRTVARELLPPVAYRFLGRIFRRIRGRAPIIADRNQDPMVQANRLRPDWHTILGGPAQGCHIFVAAQMPAFQEMVQGTYDAYFWDEVAGRDLTGATILDIGGHIGYHSLCFARLVGPTGSVHVFEPNPHNLQRMQQNLHANSEAAGAVQVHPIALADRRGDIEFSFSANIDDQTSSGGYIAGSHKPLADRIYASAGFTSATITTTTVDDFARDHGLSSIDLIKIDVEGAEHLVLAGARCVLQRMRPDILLEIHSPEAFVGVCEVLIPLGYKLRVLREEGESRFFIRACIATEAPCPGN